jgi:hypothetical protein
MKEYKVVVNRVKPVTKEDFKRIEKGEEVIDKIIKRMISENKIKNKF